MRAILVSLAKSVRVTHAIFGNRTLFVAPSQDLHRRVRLPVENGKAKVQGEIVMKPGALFGKCLLGSLVISILFFLSTATASLVTFPGGKVVDLDQE